MKQHIKAMRIHSTTASSAARAKSLMQASALALCLAWPANANATLVTGNFMFSGASFGNSAMATGWITFEQDLTQPVNFSGLVATGPVTGLQMTVTGEGGMGWGNGTYDLSDFWLVNFSTSIATLDFTKDLVGQTVGTSTWGDPGTGDFGLFRSSSPSHFNCPDYGGPFRLITSAGYQDTMVLTSMTMSAVPEVTSSFTMLGLISSGLMLRRRTKHLR
jgi:hypothetical protein